MVDTGTRAPYRERDLGSLVPGRRTVELSGKSDWAVAIGQFE
ncbi:hypothetical protein [Haloarchaeobius sp. TZWSO28]